VHYKISPSSAHLSEHQPNRGRKKTVITIFACGSLRHIISTRESGRRKLEWVSIRAFLVQERKFYSQFKTFLPAPLNLGSEVEEDSLSSRAIQAEEHFSQMNGS
jgi:hypothetical protein